MFPVLLIASACFLGIISCCSTALLHVSLFVKNLSPLKQWEDHTGTMIIYGEKNPHTAYWLSEQQDEHECDDIREKPVA